MRNSAVLSSSRKIISFDENFLTVSYVVAGVIISSDPSNDFALSLFYFVYLNV